MFIEETVEGFAGERVRLLLDVRVKDFITRMAWSVELRQAALAGCKHFRQEPDKTFALGLEKTESVVSR